MIRMMLKDERLKTIINYECFRILSILNFTATLNFYELSTSTFQHPTAVSFVPEVRFILVGDYF
jgi:hypothetical protein